MTRMGRWLMPVLALVVLPNVGCITAGVMLASKLVGDTVIDADAQKRERIAQASRWSRRTRCSVIVMRRSSIPKTMIARS